MNDPDVIAWFDPGLTTGAAVYDVAGNHFESGQYVADELPSGDHDYSAVGGYLDELYQTYGERLTVGWELYVQTPRPRPGSKARHAVGAIALIHNTCALHGIPQIKGQPSSARLAKSTVVFLRRLGWYQPGQQHANDAACHLFRHLVRMKPIPQKVRTGLPLGY